MRYFIPEWDDRVDPKYNFATEEHSKEHKDNPFSDYYMWHIFEEKEVPFDGVLVSRAKLEENKKKLELAFRDGIRKFLRLPSTFPVMGDCGAWGYISQEVPPYDSVEILDYYRKLGLDIGVTVDHLVVPKFADKMQKRMQITYENGLKGHEEWQKNYRQDFKLLVAVQGWDVQDYMKMYLDYYKHGVRNFGFGGLARSPNSFIKGLVDEFLKAIAAEKATPELVHFFGLGRFSLFTDFKRLEELGIEVSFDTASWLRRAWLSGINYYMVDDRLSGYSAIRIPQTGRRTGLRGKKKLTSEVDLELLRRVEEESLSGLRAYDQGKVEIQSVMEALHQYSQLTGIGRDLESHYLETLTDMPWKMCDCPICSSVGVEVMIFRGNNRNRRRGFHNTYVIYHNILKKPELWPSLVEQEPPEPTQIGHEELKKLTGNVLVITECTKEKIGYNESIAAKAKEMYQGQLFKTVRKYAESKGFDYFIVSAKYGLLCPDQEIKGYEKVLRTKADVEAIREAVEQRLKSVLPSYHKILVIAGSKYREVLRNLWDHRFITVKSRGYGDLCSIITKSLNKSLMDY